MIMNKGTITTTHRRHGERIQVNFLFKKDKYSDGRMLYSMQIQNAPYTEEIDPGALLFSQDRHLLQDLKDRAKTYLEFAERSELNYLDHNEYGFAQIIGKIEGSGKQ